MTIPEASLILTLDVQHMTLGEVAMFSPGGFSPLSFRDFLIKHGNWAPAEVDNVEMGELAEVAKQVSEQLELAAVPLVSGPRSSNGRGSKRKRHPVGPAA